MRSNQRWCTAFCLFHLEQFHSFPKKDVSNYKYPNSSSDISHLSRVPNPYFLHPSHLLFHLPLPSTLTLLLTSCFLPLPHPFQSYRPLEKTHTLLSTQRTHNGLANCFPASPHMQCLFNGYKMSSIKCPCEVRKKSPWKCPTSNTLHMDTPKVACRKICLWSPKGQTNCFRENPCVLPLKWTTKIFTHTHLWYKLFSGRRICGTQMDPMSAVFKQCGTPKIDPQNVFSSRLAHGIRMERKHQVKQTCW